MTFEQFLKEQWGKEGWLKDPDKDQEVFDRWLQDLDVQEWLDLGDKYAEWVAHKISPHA